MGGRSQPSRKQFCRCHLSRFIRFELLFLKILFLQELTGSAVIIGLISSFIIILYVTLRQTFSNYQKAGRRSSRFDRGDCSRKKAFESIPLKKDQRLFSLPRSNRQYVRSPGKNIHDIYQLELSQKDTNSTKLYKLKLILHFMYNIWSFTDVCRHASQDRDWQIVSIIVACYATISPMSVKTTCNKN